MALTGNMTLAFWAKEEAGGGGGWMRIIGKGGSKDRNYGLWIARDHKLMFQQYSKEGKNVVTLQINSKLQDGKWTHVAAVVSGNDVRIYVNGVEKGKAARKGKVVASSAPLLIGYAGFERKFKGLIDDVRLYSRALPAKEIAELVKLAQ